jgi:hypothetical protein
MTKELRKILADLLRRQVRLGEPFEDAIYSNLDSLYES